LANATVGVGTRGDGNGRRPHPAEPRPPTRGKDLVTQIEEVSERIHDPVAKLRYIRGSLAKYHQADRRVRAVPFSPLRRLLSRLFKLDAVRHLLHDPRTLGAPGAAPAPAPAPVGLAGVALATLLSAGAAGLATGGYYLSRPAATAEARAPLPPVAEALPALPAGVTPAKIWLVEKGDGWEQYSNGLRIDTSFVVPGEPRRYRVFTAAAGMGARAQDKPAGILFHTSESDIWPLDETFNENLRASSYNLLRYLQRNRVYNYLVDRFGRVFRIVEEEAKANHAGNSIWTRGDEIFVSLNASFLGLCFETRWEGGRALPITQAQLAAGRTLTDYLRRRWDIPPEMCVGHGLASVNPKKHLIGHHLDWARGFPFEAFGLPNQYDRAAPSVAVFGFGYDEKFLGVLGEPWPGVREAERILTGEASAQGRTVDEIRRERQGLYDLWVAEQARDQEAAAPARADRAVAGGARSTSSGG